MRKFTSWIILLLLFGITLAFFSCGSPHFNQKKKFDARLTKFKRSLRKADKTMDMIEEKAVRKAKVRQDYQQGRITESEAKVRMAAIDGQYNRYVAPNSGSAHGHWFPVWVKALGLSEPKNMVLDKTLSQVTSENANGDGYNSLTLVYRGSYKQAMKQAENIAAMAKIPMAPEYKTAMEMKRKYGDEILKGAVYMNFEPGSKNNPKYNIAITVDDKGILTISAADREKMAGEMKVLNPEK